MSVLHNPTSHPGVVGATFLCGDGIQLPHLLQHGIGRAGTEWSDGRGGWPGVGLPPTGSDGQGGVDVRVRPTVRHGRGVEFPTVEGKGMQTPFWSENTFFSFLLVPTPAVGFRRSCVSSLG